MHISYDKKAKKVTVVIDYDPAVQYPLNEKTKNSRKVDGTGGFMKVEGAEGLQLGINAIQSKSHGAPTE